MSYIKPHTWIIIALLFFSFFMSSLVSNRVFERLPHLEDEFAYTYQARIFAEGDIVIGIPQPAGAFWQPFVVNHTETNTRFGKYTPGWPLILSLGVLAGQMWIINAAFAALNVALIYRLAGEVFNRRVGLIAAALAAFSPMALLLNGTLMNHTSSLFFATAFIYTYWRIEHSKHDSHTWRWGLIGGIALGLLTISRPVSGIAIAFPFLVWSIVRLLYAFYSNLVRAGQNSSDPEPSSESEEDGTIFPQTPTLRQILTPLVTLATVALLITLLIPLFNYAAVSDATRNLYLEVWNYDKLGFGDCCGNPNSRHNIAKGINHARWDMSLMAADLFGWQIDLRDGIGIARIDGNLQEHLRVNNGYWPLFGLSFFILPIGLLVGFKSRWMKGWFIIALIWLATIVLKDGPYSLDDATLRRLSLQMIIGILWLMIPFFSLKPNDRDHKTRWTFLLLWSFVGLVLIYLAYWVGSQRYSTRYYFEALAALCIIAALGIDWLMRQASQLLVRLTPVSVPLSRMVVYGLFTITLFWSLYAYSTPRINALYRFNQVSRDDIAQIEALREDHRPVLVLIDGHSGTVRWRAYGSYMALTDPYFQSDIIAARNYAPNDPKIRQQIVTQFPDRQVIEIAAYDLQSWLVDGKCEEGEEVSVSPDCQNLAFSP